MASDGSVPRKNAAGKRLCSVEGCEKQALKGGTCIAHGGGRRCQHDGCGRSAQDSTDFCSAHGGGRRCQHDGCSKGAIGTTDFCITHGGGKRCERTDCRKSAISGTRFCIAHGGGKRCQHPDCNNSTFGTLCVTHGGGRRCHHPTCAKGAEGSTDFCVAHGGGRRCQRPECGKGAIGTTSFCAAHGGGKRCQHDECGKSAVGATDFCIAHGGGRRCQHAGCTKSAQWPTIFCTSHHPDYVPGTHGVAPDDSCIIYLGTDPVAGHQFFGIVKANGFRLDRLRVAIDHYAAHDSTIDHLFFAPLNGTMIERTIKAIPGRPTGRFERTFTESLHPHQLDQAIEIILNGGALPMPMPMIRGSRLPPPLGSIVS